MKFKQLIFATLLTCSLGAFAGTSDEAAVATRTNKRDLLKLKRPSFFSSSASGFGPAGINGGGLFINVGIFLPSKSYFNPLSASKEKLLNMGLDAEWGHFFKLIKISKFSLGLRFTWISANYTKKDSLTVMAASPMRVGVQSIIALKDKLAINFFYQIGANYTLALFNGHNYSYFGLTHEVGAGLQYRILNIGLGYRFGDLNNIYNSDGSAKSPFKYPTSNLRLYVGIKL